MVIRDTEARVRGEIATDLATLQAARARLTHATDEARALHAAFDSLDRQLGAGVAGEDQVIRAARDLLAAELARVDAAVDTSAAETALYTADGTIATVMPAETVGSSLDRRRLSLLAQAGYLTYFGPAHHKGN